MNKPLVCLFLVAFSCSVLAAGTPVNPFSQKTVLPAVPDRPVLHADTQGIPPMLHYIDPLRGYVRMVFPDEISTVRQAVTYILEPAGYRLITNGGAPLDSDSIVDKGIPVNGRIARTVPVIDALQILAGTANTIIIDPSHKLLSFEKGVRK